MLRETSPADIRADFAALEAIALQPVSSAEQLIGNLSEIYQAVSTVDFARYDINAVKAAAPALIESIFAIRLKLRENAPEWRAQGYMTHAAQKGLRDVFQVSRYGAEMLGEIVIDHRRLLENENPATAFTGPAVYTQVNPAFNNGQPVAFQSGDVVMLRGQRHNSAAIARIGDIDSQFSHLAIVYVDEAGVPWMVEALIEDGSVVTPLDQALSHSGRAVLFRHRDPLLAKDAAAAIHKRIARSRKHYLSRIPYDFTMRLDSYKRLFCSKLVRQAYDLASAGKVKPPTYGTRLEMRNNDFFQRIGVKAIETFAPGDIELEPDFDVVAEWRDLRVTSELRLKDMLMDKLFEWMDTYDYRFKETFVVRLISLFGRLSSYMSDEAKALIADVVPKVPSNMSRKAIGTIAMLHKTAEPLYKDLEQREWETIERTGHPMHPREVLAALEHMREISLGRIGYLVGRP